MRFVVAVIGALRVNLFSEILGTAGWLMESLILSPHFVKRAVPHTFFKYFKIY